MDVNSQWTPTRRIARKLVYSLIIASSIITLVITAIQLYRDYERDLNLIEARLNQIESVYVPSLASALWKTDKQELLLQLTGMIRIQDIQHLTVWENGQVIAAKGELKKENTITRVYPLQFHFRGELRTIGEFRVVATLDQVYQRLIDKVWVILISNAIKTFLIAGFMLFIVQRLITRHIVHLANQMKEISVDDLNKQLDLQRPSGRKDKPDEFDILVNAFDTMRNKIADAFVRITSREEHLRRYESIMATTTDLMSFIDRSYIFRAVNAAYATWFGKEEKEIIGHSVRGLLGKETFETVVRANLDRAFAGEHVQYITSVTDKHGKQIDVEVNYYPYFGDSDQVQGAVANIRDVSERILAEQEKLRNSRVYEALAQQGSIQFQAFLKNCLALLQQVFQAKYVIVGKLIPHSLQVRTEYVLVAGEQSANFVYNLDGTPCEKIFDNHHEFIYDDVVKKYPRDTLLEKYNAKAYFGLPLIDTRGFTMGMLVVIDTKKHIAHDWYEEILSAFAARIVLEMERADALKKLEHYNQELESRVRHRTIELENSIKEMESFSYSVSHDLRTPLRAINGFSQILLEDNRANLDETSIGYLDKVVQASEKMGSLIDSLLKLSRIGRQSLELIDLDLTSMARQSLKRASTLYSLEPAVTIQEEMHCLGDKILVQAALDNLFENAVKYSANSESPLIKFGVSHDGKHPVYYVEDNGIGFDERYANKLFEPFQRLHEESEYSGLGIGLATVKRIFLRHGGRVWGQSKNKQGATFYFTLGELVKYEVA